MEGKVNAAGAGKIRSTFKLFAGSNYTIIKKQIFFIMQSTVFMTIIFIGTLYTFFSCTSPDFSKEENTTDIVAKSKEENTADIVGKILNITQASDEAKRHGRLCTLMVVGVEPDGTEDRAIVTVTTETQIIRKGRQAVSIEELKEGREVEVQFKGPISASHPVMALAGEIRILE